MSIEEQQLVRELRSEAARLDRQADRAEQKAIDLRRSAASARGAAEYIVKQRAS